MDSNIVPLEVIIPGTKIPVVITTELHVRLQQLLLEGLQYKDWAHFITCLNEAKTNQCKDPLSYHLQTLLHLCSLIEDSAKTNGLIQKKDFSLEEKKIVSEN